MKLKTPQCLLQLANTLNVIDYAPVECDGHTLMISSALTKARISHQRICGMVKNPDADFELYPHFWIQLGDFILDYRLKMWVGIYSGEETAKCSPHGIFNERMIEYKYHHQNYYPTAEFDNSILDFMSDGFYRKINHTELASIANTINLLLVDDFQESFIGDQ